MKNIYYLVMYDYAISDLIGGSSSGTEVSAICSTLKEAKKALKKASLDERKYAKEHNWHIFADNSLVFDAGEKSCYEAEHSTFYIKKFEQNVDCKKGYSDNLLANIEKVKHDTLERYRGSITRNAYIDDINCILALVKSKLEADEHRVTLQTNEAEEG